MQNKKNRDKKVFTSRTCLISKKVSKKYFVKEIADFANLCNNFPPFEETKKGFVTFSSPPYNLSK